LSVSKRAKGKLNRKVNKNKAKGKRVNTRKVSSLAKPWIVKYYVYAVLLVPSNTFNVKHGQTWLLVIVSFRKVARSSNC